MNRKILMMMVGMIMLCLFGIMNLGVVGCSSRGTSKSIDMTKTSVCEVGAKSYNFSISKSLLDTIAAYLESENPLPSGLNSCFASTALGEGVFSLGVSSGGRIPLGDEGASIGYDFGLMNLTVVPQEVAVDVDTDSLEYDLELTWSETILSDMWTDVGDDLIAGLEGYSESQVVNILNTIQRALNVYLSTWTCTASATCAELQDTKSEVVFSCETGEVSIQDIVDEFGDELIGLFGGLFETIPDDVLNVAIPAMKFEWSLTPSENECTLETFLEYNGISLEDLFGDDDDGGGSTSLYFTNKSFVSKDGYEGCDAFVGNKFKTYVRVDYLEDGESSVFTSDMDLWWNYEDFVSDSVYDSSDSLPLSLDSGTGAIFLDLSDENDLLVSSDSQSYWCQIQGFPDDKVEFYCIDTDGVEWLRDPGFLESYDCKIMYSESRALE